MTREAMFSAELRAGNIDPSTPPMHDSIRRLMGPDGALEFAHYWLLLYETEVCGDEARFYLFAGTRQETASFVAEHFPGKPLPGAWLDEPPSLRYFRVVEIVPEPPRDPRESHPFLDLSLLPATTDMVAEYHAAARRWNAKHPTRRIDLGEKELLCRSSD